MSFSTLTNVITMLFCSAVLIQSVRLIRCLREMKSVAFGDMVASLDASTSQARRVLADLQETLRTDCAANARVIANGAAMREELTVMAGIADAVAERIVDAVGKSNPRPAAKAAEDSATPTKPARGAAKGEGKAAARPRAAAAKTGAAAKRTRGEPAPASDIDTTTTAVAA